VKYRSLPRTDLTLSEVSFGVWTVSTNWWGKVEPEDGVRLLQRAYDLGVNFFDTADTYGQGFGEEILARALGKHRHDIIIGTKFGYDIYSPFERKGHTERPQKFEAQFVRFACEQSLRRLKTDYIDIYQYHNPRLEALQKDDVWDTLQDLVKEGKVRYVGSALGPDIGWFEEGDYSMRVRKVHSLQIIYSILEQEPARRFFPIAKEHNVGLLTRVPHASEVLTDRYVNEPPRFDPTDHRAHRKREWLEKALKRAAQVRFLAEGTGRTMAQAAIKFCLAQPTVVSVLPNIVTMQELEEYLAAPETPDLTREELDRLEEIYQHNFYLEEAAPTPVEGS